MKARFVVMLVLGVLFSMAGSGLLLGGVAASLVNAAQNDGEYISSPQERFTVDSGAISAGPIEAVWDEDAPGRIPFDIADIRFRAEAVDDSEIFVGIAPQSEVDRYLAGTNHHQLLQVNYQPFRPVFREVAGEGQLLPPAEQDFWVASATGAGNQQLDWSLEPGRWSVVVMNADASPGVAVDLQAGFRSGLFGPIAAGLVITGLILLVIGIPLLILGAMGLGRHSVTQASGPGPRHTTEAGTHLPSAHAMHTAGGDAYPSRLTGELDSVLSRWKWLFKWFLAIPHFILLFFLWFAFAVVTVIAGFSILFTGRYPRSLFDFNVGVLRWNWRVGFYAYSVLGTDRYPPFTLAEVDYPATFTVDYPERLSRGLVLVKWWLLAIPHLLIVAAVTGSNTIRWADRENPGMGYETTAGLSLVGLLVIIAAVALLFTGRYIRSLFDFILGLHRWIYRVITYATLMRDEYPPFRLDQGPGEPPSPAGSTQPGPAGSTQPGTNGALR